jgi:hypothetical protein
MADANEPTRPWLVVQALWNKLCEHPGTEDVKLEDLATTDFIAAWRPLIESGEARKWAEGHGLGTHTRWVTPKLARFIFPVMHPEQIEGFVAPHDMLVPAAMAEVRYIDELGDWRVHLIGGPLSEAPN